ncbi:MAG: glycosyltransferase family 1 protein, partial [Planctomycetota bacterium]
MLAENDPAGTAIGFARAVNRLTPHRCRLITWQRRYVCEFGDDLHLPDLPPGRWDEVATLLRDADVVHFHMLADERLQLGPWNVGELIAGKPAVVRHHHGHPLFRANLAHYQQRYANERAHDVVLVSTPDMLALFPPGRAVWQPNLVALDSPAFRPTTPSDWQARRGQPLRVQQSPTRRNIKSTDQLEALIQRL